MRFASAFLILLATVGCGRPVSASRPMAAHRLSVPIASGAVVEISNEREGWSERFEASSVVPAPIETWPAAPVVPGAVARAVAAFEPRRGRGTGNCQVVADRFYTGLVAAGIPSRRVDLSVRLGSPYEGHAGVEVWSEEDRAWVYLDPFFAATYRVDGRAASALDLHRAVTSGRLADISMATDGSAADPWGYRINPLLYFRNIMIGLPGGRWLVYRPAGARAEPLAETVYVFADSDAAFTAPPSSPVAVVASRLERRGVVAEVADGRLWVAVPRDAFAAGGWMVRVWHDSVQPVFAYEAEAYDLDDPALCRPGELLANPTLADVDGDSAPDGWSVTGRPARLAREGDALVVETGAEAYVLTAEADLEADLPLVAAGRFAVELGSASFEFVERRGEFAAALGEGPPTAASPALVRARPHDGVRIAVAPNSRCRIAAVGLRYGRTLHESLSPTRPTS